jgi:hypothetical protein
MADYCFYWRHFARERKRGDWPAKAWYSNDDQLAKRIAAGDRVWLLSSGEACGQAELKSAYLVEVFAVQKAIRNAGEDKEYPTNEFHYLLVAQPEAVHKIDPPLLVDAIVRGENQPKEEPIGRFLQKPRKMPEEWLAKLQAELTEKRPEAAKLIFGT